MGKISERLGDRLEPGNTGQEIIIEEPSQDANSVKSYPVHYSEEDEGDLTTLNFSDPVGERTLTPDYTAKRVYSGEEDVWRVGSEEGTFEVNVPSDIDSQDRLADELKNAYREALN